MPRDSMFNDWSGEEVLIALDADTGMDGDRVQRITGQIPTVLVVNFTNSG